jgi:hypothetical protein
MFYAKTTSGRERKHPLPPCSDRRTKYVTRPTSWGFIRTRLLPRWWITGDFLPPLLPPPNCLHSLVFTRTDNCTSVFFTDPVDPGQRSRYSDWLRAGRPRGQSSSPGRVKNFLFSTSSRQLLGPNQLPIQWVPGALSSNETWIWVICIGTHMNLGNASEPQLTLDKDENGDIHPGAQKLDLLDSNGT